MADNDKTDAKQDATQDDKQESTKVGKVEVIHEKDAQKKAEEAAVEASGLHPNRVPTNSASDGTETPKTGAEPPATGKQGVGAQ